MIISYRWLSQYLPVSLSIDKLSHILTSIGLEVEAVETAESIKGSLEGLIIGEVLTCAKHPDADKLSVTTVSIGSGEPLNIVCGAPNVAAGQKVVIAPVGATVHPTTGDSFPIKKAKIRGAASEGMICAEDEIGLGNSHAGIMVLLADAPVGTPAKEYFKIPEADQSIHIGLTPNRSDAMSHLGVARDVCAYLTHHTGKAHGVKAPEVAVPAKTADLPFAIKVEATEACPRYTGITLTGIKVGPSPEWLQQRLQAIEVRSINNIVDVTNFVLHEYGQPLHAFDADKMAGNTIRVAFLPEGTPFTTLDGKERKLHAADLMICDAEKPACIAGVFGGADSGITDSTTNIFLESAAFDASHIRRTSLAHGLRTDAATHFEKGIDINKVPDALLRAVALIQEVAGGQVASEVYDVYPTAATPVTVACTYSYIQKLTGKLYDNDTILTLLKALGFTIQADDATGFTVQVPTNKTDVKLPADIVEEILRIDGLDNVAIPQRLNISLTTALPTDRELRRKAAMLLCGQGFQELVTNSITNSKFYPDEPRLVHMLNSLSSELDILRPSMLESGLEIIGYNANRKQADLLLFDFGKVYHHAEGTQYIETEKLAIYATGNTAEGGWNTKPKAADAYYLKGIIENLFRYFGIQKVAVSYEQGTTVWKWKNETLCTAGQATPDRLKLFDIKADVFYATIDWAQLVKAAAQSKIKYTEVPKFPAVQRDLALVLDSTVTYQQIQQSTDKLKLQGLQTYNLFDVFQSDKLGAGKKSLAISYTFQTPDRTLTDAETDGMMQQLISAYKKDLDAQIRG